MHVSVITGIYKTYFSQSYDHLYKMLRTSSHLKLLNYDHLFFSKAVFSILENHILVTDLCKFEIVKTVCLPFLRLTVNKAEI